MGVVHSGGTTTASVAPGPESESNWKNALLLTKFLQVLPVTTTILEFDNKCISLH